MTFKTLCAALAMTILPSFGLANACADRDAIVKVLSKTHGEYLAGRGVQGEQNLYEIWLSNDTGSWTILRTSANGMACIMAVGTHWLPGLPQPEGVPG